MSLKLAAVAALNMFFMTCVLPAQQATSPHFEVAIIKKNTSGTGSGGGSTPGGQLHPANLTLSELLEVAFGLRDYAIIYTGWTRTDRFDVSAKAPDGAGDADIPRMLQSLLAEDFKLEVHAEMRPQDVFALVVAKGGPKLQPAADLATSGCVRTFIDGNPHAECKGVTMARFTDQLRILGPGYIDRPVVDLTGIEGAWDFQIDWVGAAKIADGGLTILDVVNKQLGLKLDQQKPPAKVLVVDHAEHLQDN